MRDTVDLMRRAIEDRVETNTIIHNRAGGNCSTNRQEDLRVLLGGAYLIFWGFLTGPLHVRNVSSLDSYRMELLKLVERMSTWHSESALHSLPIDLIR